MTQKVTSGEKLAIQADVWNELLDVAQAERNRRHATGGIAGASGLTTEVMLAKNGSGIDALPGMAFSVSGFAMQPKDKVNLLQSVLKVAVAEEDDKRAIAISLDSCKAGDIGRFKIFGAAVVKLERKPEEDEFFAVAGEGGKVFPSESGQARILAVGDSLSLILIAGGSGGAAAARGMFQLVRIGDGRLRICDGANVAGNIAGIAEINAQSYSCEAREFDLTAQIQYFFLKFTPPRIVSGQMLPSACELVAFADTEAVVSTDMVFYALIGHAWIDGEGEEAVVKIVQDHKPGPLRAKWMGPCINLLAGVLGDD